MQDRLNIPKTIRVGFQKRTDTYTGKLAYVVYRDKKDKTCKEKSWQGWIDKGIATIDYPNEPTIGFVLNKGVGGVSHSWNWHGRREKVRVYDPRDFEFEISVENLLFILQECSAIKGKGLEGEFVYSWSGSELVLLPVDSKEYKASSNFCDLQTQKVTASDVVPGCTYLTKNKEEVMYLGRFDWYIPRQIGVKYTETNYGRDRVRKAYHTAIEGKKQHVFLRMNSQDKKINSYNYFVDSGFTKLGVKTTNEPIPQFADEYEKLANSHLVSKPIRLELGDHNISKRDQNRSWGNYICVQHNDKYYMGNVSEDWTSNINNVLPKKYIIKCSTLVTLEDGIISYIDQYSYDKMRNGESMNYFERDKVPIEVAYDIVKGLYAVCENGARYKLGDSYE